MSETVTVCCRLPNGFIFHNPSDNDYERKRTDNKIYLNGANRSYHFDGKKKETPIILADVHYGETQVKKDVWEAIEKIHGKDFAPFRSGAIFLAKNDKDKKEKMNEAVNNKIKTGFEATDTEGQLVSLFDQ